MIRVKICGITNINDASAAVESGADALGFVFYKDSKRYIEPARAYEIISLLPPFITTVGVFVNPSIQEIKDAVDASDVDAVQLHGDETPEFCSTLPYKTIKAIRVRSVILPDNIELYPVQAILFDSYSDVEYGGTGRGFSKNLLRGVSFSKQIILSGGLNPDNVEEAISTVQPYAVDVSTGVEDSPGKKNASKVRQFIEVVKNAG